MFDLKTRRVTQKLSFLLLLILVACEGEVAPQSEPVRPVRVILAQSMASGETLRLTGDIRAEDLAVLSFRTGGRLVTRSVGVGESVEAGDLIGRLEDVTQLNNVRSAEAELFAAEGDVDRTSVDYSRQSELLERGFTTRQRYDTALQVYRQAQARANAARAQLENARETLAFTALYADAPGVVTAVGAEPGEVVGAGTMVVQLAREEGRDAVFDVPERVLRAVPYNADIRVALVSDPSITTTGRVREVSPQADPITRTFQVRVGLAPVPEEFRLGSAVTGNVTLQGSSAIPLPASALTTVEGRPAVFVVNSETESVELRPVEIGTFDLSQVMVISGLVEGEVVVTAGTQALRNGQAVRVGGGI
ncbi:efflux RND transporter periplasmic adaptor subunit [Pseudovibrio exalbescens]|uniref:efflux RND transporter periplasmic adaptor subunit n=1 Tax=Pseudovibrio exalbescens TaxID=197461 RepID=UPI0023657F10|nr:efflux RND transporter periplasmic adaptor subunit [Pseudovibrio exalbescens]MDD7911990.1 efflux RND transporter periplasmic adaptor subunit [Pseudovibrio exalbescens]